MRFYTVSLTVVITTSSVVCRHSSCCAPNSSCHPLTMLSTEGA